GDGKDFRHCWICPSATSVFTRPMRLRAGEVAGFRRRRSGNASPARYLPEVTCSTQGGFIRQWRAVSVLSNCSATAGSGRPASTSGTRVTSHFLARSANTTASLCVVRWFYAEDPVSHLRITSARPTATSFNRQRAGSSLECVWRLKRFVARDAISSAFDLH